MLPGIAPHMAGYRRIGGNDANTIFLSHLNGADGATSFTDISKNALAITTIGNAQVDTAQSKFGGACALFDGTLDRLDFSHADLAHGTGDFSIDCWLRLASTGRVHFICGSNTSGGVSFSISAANKLVFAQAYVADRLTGAASLAANTWYHVALTRTGGTARLFLDGVVDGSVANSDNLVGTGRSVGGYAGLSTDSLNGWIDEIRCSKIARWTAAFTPPVEAYG